MGHCADIQLFVMIQQAKRLNFQQAKRLNSTEATQLNKRSDNSTSEAIIQN
jgi:hypothetical protein